MSFGQDKGQKLVEGNNKTPKGMYVVIQKHRGNLGGTYGAYYGGHWIKINYPNKYDADRGASQQMISRQQQAAITAAWKKQAATSGTTKLGGTSVFMAESKSGTIAARVIFPGAAL